MAAKNYLYCEAQVLASEGGYSDNPHDPGGPTNWGITLADARLYWKPQAEPSDVKSMPKSVAQAIYKQKYWDALNCDALPSGLDYAVFDYGVNSGISRSGKELRAVLGLPSNAWVVSDIVVQAAQRGNVPNLIRTICADRLKFLQGLSIWAEFGKGWTTRVNHVQAASLQLANATAVPPTPAPVPGKGVASSADLFLHHIITSVENLF